MARAQLPLSPMSLFLVRVASQAMTIPHSPSSAVRGSISGADAPPGYRGLSAACVEHAVHLVHGDLVLDRVLTIGAGLERCQQVVRGVLRLGQRHREVLWPEVGGDEEAAGEREAVPGCRGQAGRGVERQV